MNKIIPINKPPLSDARLKCFSDYTPVRDVEVVDTEQKIFKGNRVIEPGTASNVMTVIYFRRVGKKDDRTEIEQMWPEIHIHDCTIMGYEFYLIPKVKMLFGYDPPSKVILKPPIRAAKPGPFQR